MDSTGINNAVLGDLCIPCASSCKTCQVNPDQCTSCYENNTLYSSTCVGIFTVTFQYELDGDYDNFVQQCRSQDAIEAISEATNTNPNKTFVNNVDRGSIILGGMISTDSSAQAINVHSKIGNTLSGFTVISSSATVYYGSSPYTAPTD